MTEPSIREAAEAVWDYMRLGQELVPADIIVALGSSDMRTAERAAELFKQGFGQNLICSGARGSITSGSYTRPQLPEGEAAAYKKVLLENNVPEEKVYLETASTNSGENIINLREFLGDLDIPKQKVLFVHKPYMERRVFATAKKVWPELNFQVTSPELTFEEYLNDEYPEDYVVNVMVGDLDRIMKYSEKGYQIPQEVPTNVLKAFQILVRAGFNQRLVK